MNAQERQAWAGAAASGIDGLRASSVPQLNDAQIKALLVAQDSRKIDFWRNLVLCLCAAIAVGLTCTVLFITIDSLFVRQKVWVAKKNLLAFSMIHPTDFELKPVGLPGKTAWTKPLPMNQLILQDLSKGDVLKRTSISSIPLKVQPKKTQVMTKVSLAGIPIRNLLPGTVITLFSKNLKPPGSVQVTLLELHAKGDLLEATVLMDRKQLPQLAKALPKPLQVALPIP